MPWLLRDGDVLATLEERQPGWQESLRGAVVLSRRGLVQTLAGRAAHPLDMAWCVPTVIDGDHEALRVRRIVAVAPRRIHFGRLVVAPAGTFERWNLRVGDCLEVR